MVTKFMSDKAAHVANHYWKIPEKFGKLELSQLDVVVCVTSLASAINQ